MKKKTTPTKQSRLAKGKAFIASYNGKHIITGYSRRFKVDKICAIKELKILGVEFPAGHEQQVINSYNQLVEERKERKRQKAEAEKMENENPLIYGLDYDETYSLIMGFTSGGAAYGITHEEISMDELMNNS
jgi:hypothetical protein